MQPELIWSGDCAMIAPFRFHCGDVERSELISHKTRSALLSLPDDCTDDKLPFSAVLHSPFGRNARFGVCSYGNRWPVIDEVLFGTSGGTRLLAAICALVLGRI